MKNRAANMQLYFVVFSGNISYFSCTYSHKIEIKRALRYSVLLIKTHVRNECGNFLYFLAFTKGYAEIKKVLKNTFFL